MNNNPKKLKSHIVNATLCTHLGRIHWNSDENQPAEAATKRLKLFIKQKKNFFFLKEKKIKENVPLVLLLFLPFY